MCGRFVISSDLEEWSEFFGADEIRTESLRPSWNVAPTDPVYGLVQHEDRRRLGSFRWGLIPHYADNRRSIHINARAETLAEKGAFRTSFARRRCLIGADGFYEWQRLGDRKQPYFIVPEGSLMAFAGIWSRWTDPVTEERMVTCAIITRSAEGEVAQIHDRMPATLDPVLWDDWLDPGEQDPGLLRAILESGAPAQYELRPVSTLVNSVRNNDARLVEPVA